jgi:hypothetical protein
MQAFALVIEMIKCMNTYPRSSLLLCLLSVFLPSLGLSSFLR